MFEVLLVPVALVVVDQSVFVSELEFHFAERASGVVEAVKAESIQFCVLVLLNDFVEGLSSFLVGSGFSHFFVFIIISSLMKFKMLHSSNVQLVKKRKMAEEMKFKSKGIRKRRFVHATTKVVA